MFLPEEYKVPVSGGNYMKLQDGENNIRILGSAIVGWEYWNEKNSPVRSKERFVATPADIRMEVDKKTGESYPSKIKHFWAFPVWNYDAKAVQILQITQQTIMTGIKALVDNKKWGDPKNYDITISRKGEGFDTEYSVIPSPHTPIEDEILAACEKKTIHLENLYVGGDPFAAPKSMDGDRDVSPEAQEEAFNNFGK